LVRSGGGERGLGALGGVGGRSRGGGRTDGDGSRNCDLWGSVRTMGGSEREGGSWVAKDMLGGKRGRVWGREEMGREGE